MDHLSAQQLQLLQDQLRAERKALLAGVSPQLEALPIPEGEPRDFSDIATEDEMRSLLMQLDQRHRVRLVEIDAALVRMRENRYGICEDTEEEIPFARLRIDPTFRFTAEAQEELEELERRRRQLVEDEQNDVY